MAYPPSFILIGSLSNAHWFQNNDNIVIYDVDKLSYIMWVGKFVRVLHTHNTLPFFDVEISSRVWPTIF